MKKYFILAVCGLMLLSAASCGKQTQPEETTVAPEEIISQAEEVMSFSAADYENVSDFAALADEAAAVVANSGSLSDEQKADVEGVSDVADTLKTWNETAVACAKTYCEGFKEAFPDGGEIKKVGCILRIQDGKAFMMYALTAEKDGAEKNYYATARFDDPSIKSVLASRTDLFYVDAPLDAQYDALTNGNLTLNVEELLKADEETTAEEGETADTAEADVTPEEITTDELSNAK